MNRGYWILLKVYFLFLSFSYELLKLIISLLTLISENLQALFFATIKVKVDLHKVLPEMINPVTLLQDI